MAHDTIRIGELARRTGASVHTLRYWERRGLLAPRSRRASGYREYGGDAERRVRAIRWAKGLGLTLGEMARVLPGDHARPRGALRRQLAARLAVLDRQAAALARQREAIVALLACRCHGRCPVIEAAIGPEVHP